MTLRGLLLISTALLLVPLLLAQRRTQVGTTTTEVTVPVKNMQNPVVGPRVEQPQAVDGDSGNLKDGASKYAAKDDVQSRILEHMHAGMILDYSTFIVGIMTAVFAIFLGFFGVLEWYRFDKVRKEISAQRKELKEDRRSLKARIDTFKADIQTQEKRLTANQRFLEAVLLHHTTLLVGIVEGFGAALKSEEARRLTSLIAESEAALDLFHPDAAEVMKALLRLEQIGAEGSVSSLVQLKNDDSTDTNLRLRAQEVLMTVKSRLKRQDAH